MPLPKVKLVNPRRALSPLGQRVGEPLHLVQRLERRDARHHRLAQEGDDGGAGALRGGAARVEARLADGAARVREQQLALGAEALQVAWAGCVTAEPPVLACISRKFRTRNITQAELYSRLAANSPGLPGASHTHCRSRGRAV